MSGDQRTSVVHERAVQLDRGQGDRLAELSETDVQFGPGADRRYRSSQTETQKRLDALEVTRGLP